MSSQLPEEDLIRKKALEILAQREVALGGIDAQAVPKLVHELQIHQIELELQNEELRRIQYELEETVRKYNHLYDFAPIGYVTLDRRLAITEINLAGAQQLGADRSALVNRPFTHFILPSFQDTFYFHCREITEKKGRTACEIKIRRQNGTVFTAQIESIAVLEADRTVGSIRSAVIDISDRKRAEDFARNILETVDESFIIIDRNYRIVSANRAFCNFVQTAPQDIIGKQCYRVTHQREAPCFTEGEECAVRHTFLTGEPKEVLHTHYDGNRRPFYMETRSFPFKDESGAVVSAIEVLTDITEKRRLEEQLHQSQKMEAVGVLAGGIAHDFNNVLSAILASAYILREQTGRDGVLVPFIDEIIMASERGGNLTSRLLAFSRKQISHPEQVFLNDIVRKMERLLARIIGEDVELTITMPEDDLAVLADASQLEQVVMNLAANARDAMPGGGRLQVALQKTAPERELLKTHDCDDTGEYALLSVSDNGTGMDQATQERVFEPFFTTKEPGKGTGLGLSIVYGIVKQHKGFVTVSSGRNQGTTFSIYLPLSRDKQAKKEAAPVIDAVRGSETVLLAEDDEAVRKLSKAVLEDAGYTVIEAADGDGAIQAFEQHKERIEVLLLDVVMPGKGGKEVADLILKEKPDIRTIFMSGYTADMLQSRGISGEPVSFIRKPLAPDALLRKIRSVLDGS